MRNLTVFSSSLTFQIYFKLLLSYIIPSLLWYYATAQTLKYILIYTPKAVFKIIKESWYFLFLNL